MKLDTSDKVFGGCAALSILAYLAFWGAAIYVAVHFIQKFW